MEVHEFITNKIEIKGNRFLRWIYKLSLKYYKRKEYVIQKKLKKLDRKILNFSDKTFVILNINFYNPRLLIVRYEEINTKFEYEITFQDNGNWNEYFKEFSETKKIPFKLKHQINMELTEQYRNAIRIK
tara:strand:+ start:154 stop:540 length:387 start_codon:yes stop_codon:yes gene_type:complete